MPFVVHHALSAMSCSGMYTYRVLSYWTIRVKAFLTVLIMISFGRLVRTPWLGGSVRYKM